ALLFRDGHICEDCIGRAVPWPGVAHACYRGSHAASAVAAGMLTVHRAIGTWDKLVDVYLACSEFAREKFIAGGLPASRVRYKPNCLMEDPGAGQHEGQFALFVGRLAPEKGIRTLLDAWGRLDSRIPLRVIGDGPLGSLFQQPTPGVEWLGRQPRDAV